MGLGGDGSFMRPITVDLNIGISPSRLLKQYIYQTLILLLNASSMKPLIMLVEPARLLYLGLSRFQNKKKICADVMNRVKSPKLNKTARMFSLTVTLKHTVHYNFCHLEELLDNESF